MPVITVTAAIIVKDSHILAARRRAGMHLAGLWEFPGGKLEPGETPEQCLARELTEEFGIETHIGRYLGESVHDDGEKIVRLLAYRVTHVSGDFALTDHDALKWLARDALYSVQWAPADIPLVAQAVLILD
jgi:8-oxo-dGTP diphosphatase